MTRPAQVRALWRRWRTWLIIGLVVLVGGVAIAALHTSPGNQYLSPDAVAGDGTHALADILTGLGHEVITVASVPAAARAATPGSTLVITSPQYLSRPDLFTLSRVPASLVLVEPDHAALAALAAGSVRLFGASQPVVVTEPACTLAAATLAGTADMGGENMVLTQTQPTTEDQECYTSTSGPTLVQLQVRGRMVTLLGTGAPLTNARLASAGNAALAINLLPSHRVVWLVPPVAVVAASAAAGPRTFTSLLPVAVYLVTIQLLIAALLAAVWRARRLGQLVFEPLPVVVRAAETTEGHGRLYQSRHARAQAADALRAALRGRLQPAVGLPPGAEREAIVAALAQRSALPPARISELVFSQPPATDQDLLALARDLDNLEREVGTT
jgi:hypothetical protein